MISKILYFFDKEQRKLLIFLFGFMLIATFLEMTGLGFVFSIVGSINPEGDKSNFLTNFLVTNFQLDSTQILSYLLIFFLIFYLIKILFLIFYNWFESNFLYSYKEQLSSKVFKSYLNQNFSFFYNRNSCNICCRSCH